MGRKVYEVFIERDPEYPQNENWVIYSGSRRMASAFKEGAIFFSKHTRRIKIRERIEDGNHLQTNKTKMEYYPNKVPHANDGDRS